MANKIKGGGSRKYGRNQIWCKAYRARGQRAKNKKARLVVHVAKHPNDLVAKNVKVQ